MTYFSNIRCPFCHRRKNVRRRRGTYFCAKCLRYFENDQLTLPLNDQGRVCDSGRTADVDTEDVATDCDEWSPSAVRDAAGGY